MKRKDNWETKWRSNDNQVTTFELNNQGACAADKPASDPSM